MGRQLLRNPAATGWRPDHPTNAPRGQYGEFTTDRKIAAKWHAQYIAAVHAGLVRRQKGEASAALRLADEKRAYLNDRSGAVEASTMYGIQGALNWLERKVGPDTDPSLLTVADLQGFTDWLLGEKHRQRGTVKQILNNVGPFLRRYGADPVKSVVLPRPLKRMKQGWSAAQVRRIREAADAVDALGLYKINARLAVELALCTGARVGELFAIRWENIERRYCRVLISEQAVKLERRVRHTKGKTDGFALVMPEWWDFHDDAAVGLVLNIGGAPIYDGPERDILMIVMEHAGLKVTGEGNHMYRHAYARRFLEQCGDEGVDGIPLLQLYLRHSDSSVTREYYGHYGAGVRHEHAVRVFYPAPRKLGVVA